VNVGVLIVGAGPAGLAAAVELRRLGAGSVLVADREETPGGVPRHCAHTGFGLRDLHRVMTGPGYARHYAAAAAAAGADVRTVTTVTGWDRERTVTMTSPRGVETVRAGAILLATGCRERPRAARLIPGGRPPGVMTTGELQQRVYLNGERFGGRAVVVGAEHVSFSAMVTLAHAGAQVAGLVTEYPRSQSFAAFSLAASLRWHVPVWTSTAVTRVVGLDRLAGVDLARVGVAETGLDLDLDLAGAAGAAGGAGAGPAGERGGGAAGERGGGARFVPCDLLVFTGDWIPDHELARRTGADIDPGTRGPAVDTALETSLPMVFAAGNLVHAAETADVAAAGGRHAARQIAAALMAGPALEGVAGPALEGALSTAPELAATLQGSLHGSPGPVAGARIPLIAGAPLTWVFPNALRIGGPQPPRGRFLLRTAEFGSPGHFEVRQDGRVLARIRHGRLVPGRSVSLTAAWATRAAPAAGPVRIALA
jgi:thioredoxin reductase